MTALGINSLFNIENKRVLVTGAQGGIGKGICELFSAAGAKLTLADRQSSYPDAPEGAHYIATDFSSDKGSAELLSYLDSNPIDILIHTAGIEGYVGNMEDTEKSDWLKTIEINLYSAQLLSARAIKAMQQRGGGRLIYIGSIAGLRGTSALGLYSITKAGLSQLARNYAVQQGKYAVTANCICPGLIDTPLSKPLQSNESFMQKRLAQTPLNRIGKVEEIAGTALYLASNAGAFTTGQSIVVDGGTTISDQ